MPEKARWDYISKHANDQEIGQVIANAMVEIEKENIRLKGILSKTFARPELDKRRLGEVVDIFTNMPLVDNSDKKDIIGRTYEYCLSMFAEQEGKRAGGMFVQSANFVKNHHGNIRDLSVYGQEANPTTWKLAQMNLAIRGIEADLGETYVDTFFNEQHPTLRADFVMANPPISIL